jgi:hypothetical protein
MKKFGIGIKENSHSKDLSTFASRTSPSTDQSLQKSFHLYHAGQNFKIFSQQNEKLKHPTHSLTMVANSTKTMVYRHSEQERQHTTGVWRQWRVTWLIEHSASHQLLWCIDSFVLRNPPLRQAPNRYQQY